MRSVVGEGGEGLVGSSSSDGSNLRGESDVVGRRNT